MLNGKAMIAILTLRHFRPNVKVKLDLFNYATKTDFKKHKRSWYIKIWLKILI